MNLFEQLRQIVLKQNQENDFPTWLMTDILVIADEPKRYTDKIHLVELLINQISNFDQYAGTGCFDTSVSSETIGTTIRQILTS